MHCRRRTNSKLTELCSASYASWQLDTARICCWAPCCRGTVAAGRPPLSTDIACPPGPQQQTRSTLLRWNRQTDGQTPFRYVDPAAYYASSVSENGGWRPANVSWESYRVSSAAALCLRPHAVRVIWLGNCTKHFNSTGSNWLQSISTSRCRREHRIISCPCI